MSDYIKREVVCDALDELCDRVCAYSKRQRFVMCGSCPLGSSFDVIEELPAADVVEVVRCKDCKWCHSGYCEMYDDLIPFGCANRPWEEWFCADGARMDGDS